MKKNIWIIHHDAGHMYFEHSDRYYWYADNLRKKGYSPTIFCASTIHKARETLDVGKGEYAVKIANEIPFVFIKTPEYKGNGFDRIINILTFYRRIKKVAKRNYEEFGRPDVILASSPHPFSAIAGLNLAKSFDVPCICEVRDLWPESIIAYGVLGKYNPLSKLLYAGEKWIYKKADALIFTMEGGKDYIKKRNWERTVNIDKVHHINNGLDLEQYDYNASNYQVIDDDLDDNDSFKVIYVGSIRKIYNMGTILEVANKVKEIESRNIRFLIYGDGPERKPLEITCAEKGIDNVVFKGGIDRKYVPYILSKSDLNLLHNRDTEVMKYGGSQRKIFDYLASGKPILNTVSMNYDIVEKYKAGTSIRSQCPNDIAKEICNIANMDKETYDNIGRNARKASQNYDFSILSEKLTSIIEKL